MGRKWTVFRFCHFSFNFSSVSRWVWCSLNMKHRKWTSGNENNARPGLPRGDNGHDGEGAFDQYDGSASQILNLVIFCQSTCCLLLTCSSWPGTNFSLFFTKEKKVESAKNKKLEKHLFLWSWKITAVMVKNLAPMQQKTGSFFLFSSECHSSSYFSCKL